MDTLSNVLSAIRLSSGAFLDAELTAPWSISARVAPEDCRPLGRVPAHLVAYHFVVDGALFITLEGVPPIALFPGDMVLLPRNDYHCLSSQPGLAPIVPDDLIAPPSERSTLARLLHGGGGERTRLVCGFLGCEVADNVLLGTLPPVLRLSPGAAENGVWMAESFRFAAREFAENRFGSASILTKLAELLFIEAIRRYLAGLPEDQTGWLAGLRDPFVGKALKLVHSRTAEPWTTERLANQVGLSRSAFADRFTRLIGTPPMSYLARWRMQIAALRLRETAHGTTEIAWEVGYESDAAFHRAFKRAYGMTPSAWRKGGIASVD